MPSKPASYNSLHTISVEFEIECSQDFAEELAGSIDKAVRETLSMETAFKNWDLDSALQLYRGTFLA